MDIFNENPKTKFIFVSTAFTYIDDDFKTIMLGTCVSPARTIISFSRYLSLYYFMAESRIFYRFSTRKYCGINDMFSLSVYLLLRMFISKYKHSSKYADFVEARNTLDELSKRT